MTLIRISVRFLKPYKGWLAGLVVLQAVQAVTQLLLPALIGDVVDRGALRGDVQEVLSQGLLMLLIASLSLLASAGAVWCGSRAALGMARDLRAAAFSKVLSWSAREVTQHGAGSLTTRLTNDVMHVQQLVAAACAVLLVSPLTVVGGVLMAVREDRALSVVLVVAVPLMVVAMGILLKRTGVVSVVLQDQLDRLNGVVRDQVVGMRVVRAFVREPLEIERFERVNARLTKAMLSSGQLMALMMPLIILILNLASVAVLLVGAARVDAGQASVGQIVTFLTYLGIVLVAVVMTGFTAAMLPRAAVCARRVQEVLDTSTSLAAPETLQPLTSMTQVDVRGAGFRYPGAETPVLDGVSFSLRSGRTTAVVGSTGAGKSTLVNVIARLIDVTDGAVVIDNTDVRAVDPRDLRRHIAIVPQRPYLFSGTVASNLRLGTADASDDELWAALEAAQAADVVRALPSGLEARIEQGGTNLSGGQRQRLCIARALVRRPALYLFDDSFSALDAATESRLRSSLQEWTGSAACLIVSERISSISSADEILVLEAGTLVGRGTHEELLLTCPTYAEIADSQAANEVAA